MYWITTKYQFGLRQNASCNSISAAKDMNVHIRSGFNKDYKKHTVKIFFV